MNTAELFTAINTRAMADNGAGGLTTLLSATTAFYYAAIPENVDMPFCLLTTASMSDESAFTRNVVNVTFRIATFVNRTDATITNPVQRLSDIVKRLYGDSSASGTTPSYGFHRHLLALSDWTGGHCVHRSTFDEHGDDYYCTVLEFVVYVSK